MVVESALMNMEGASIADHNVFDAERLHTGTDLLMHGMKFRGPADLKDAHIDGQMDMAEVITRRP